MFPAELARPAPVEGGVADMAHGGEAGEDLAIEVPVIPPEEHGIHDVAHPVPAVWTVEATEQDFPDGLPELAPACVRCIVAPDDLFHGGILGVGLWLIYPLMELDEASLDQGEFPKHGPQIVAEATSADGTAVGFQV